MLEVGNCGGVEQVHQGSEQTKVLDRSNNNKPPPHLLELIVYFLLDDRVRDFVCGGNLMRNRDGDVILVLLLRLEVGDHEVSRVDGLLVSPHRHYLTTCVVSVPTVCLQSVVLCEVCIVEWSTAEYSAVSVCPHLQPN